MQEIVPSRTHDVEALLHLCIPHCGRLAGLRKKIGWLTQFATEIRYPQEDEVTPEEAEKALSQAEEVQEIVDKWLDADNERSSEKSVD